MEHGFVVGRFVDSDAGLGPEPVISGSIGRVEFIPMASTVLTETTEVPAKAVRRSRSFTLDGRGVLGEMVDGQFRTGVWLAVGRWRVRTHLRFTDDVDFMTDVTPGHTVENPLSLPLEAPVELPPHAVEVVRTSDRVRAEAAAGRAESALEGVGEAIDNAFPVQPSALYSIPEDYPTIQDAVNDLYLKNIEQGAVIELRISEGHNPSSGVEVSNGDYSNFRVTSVDPIVPVSESFEGNFIGGKSAAMPTLACLVDMRNLGGDGLRAENNSRGLVEPYCGIQNAGGTGCYVGGSSVWAFRSEFSGSNNRNLWITRTSSFCGERGIFSKNKGGAYMVYVSRASRATLDGADCTGALEIAIAALRSQINAMNVDVSDAGSTGLHSTQGSSISFRGGQASNCNRGIVALDGSTLDAGGAQITGSRDSGAVALAGSALNLNGATVTGSANFDISTSGGSTVNANGATYSTRNITAHNTPSPNGIVFGPTPSGRGVFPNEIYVGDTLAAFDTGWRNVSSLATTNLHSSSDLLVRRTMETLYLSGRFYFAMEGSGLADLFSGMPAAWLPQDTTGIVATRGSNLEQHYMRLTTTGILQWRTSSRPTDGRITEAWFTSTFASFNISLPARSGDIPRSLIGSPA